MKKCKYCGEEKELMEFRKSKRHRDGHLNECKICISVKRKEYYLSNIYHHKVVNKAYYENNKIEIYKKVNKDKKRENNKKYTNTHKNELKLKRKLYYENNKDRIKEKSRKYYEENKDIINIPSDNKRKIRRDSYRKRKYQYIWREILRRTVYQLKHKKNQTTGELLGYSYDELKINLEAKFLDGMNWENHGEWHVDHIIHISLFKKGTDPSIVNRLDNLRPLWSCDNLSKQSKIDTIEVEYGHLLDELKEFLI